MSVDAFPAFETTRKRRRWGCTCGCLFLFIVLLCGGLLGTYYTLRSNRPVPRVAMMDPTVNGFGILRLDMSDPGTGDIVKFIFRRVEQKQTAGKPESDAKVISGFMKILRHLLSTLVQPEVPLYFSYDPASGKESIVGVLPLKNKLSREMVEQLLEEKAGAPMAGANGVDQYGLKAEGEETTSTILALGPSALLYANDTEMLSRALVYRRQPAREGQPAERLQQYLDELALDQPPEGEDGTIVLINEEGRLTRLLETLEQRIGVSGLVERLEGGLAAQRTSLADVLAMKCTLDLQALDKAGGDLTLYFRQSDTVNRFATVLKQALPQITGKRQGSDVALHADMRTRGTAIVISWTLTGLKGWLEGVFPAPPVATASPAGEAAPPARAAPAEDSTPAPQ